MKPNLTIIAVLSFGFTGPVLAEQNADELKQRVLAQAQSMSPDDFAFTRTSHGEQISNGKTELTVTVEKFDPTKAGDARWTLVSVNNVPPSAAEVKQFQAEVAKRKVPGYYRLANYFGTAATSSTDAKGRTVFHFGSLPKDTVRVMDTDVSHNATAEASVNDTGGAPSVEQIRVTVKPMRIKLIAKLDSYESTSRYRLGPEGKPVLSEQTVDMAGSGMGQEGRGHVVITYSDYRPVNGHR
jgi:hypothetical protein